MKSHNREEKKTGKERRNRGGEREKSRQNKAANKMMCRLNDSSLVQVATVPVPVHLTLITPLNPMKSMLRR